MKICPRCGKVVSYNSYFGAYICDNCNWEDSTAGRLRDEGSWTCGTSTVVMQRQTVVTIRKAARKGRAARVDA